MSALCALRLPEGQSSLYSSRCIEIIDCLQLPHSIVWHKIHDCDEAFEAIKSMKIRGAPAIASLAAIGIVLAFAREQSSPRSAVSEGRFRS